MAQEPIEELFVRLSADSAQLVRQVDGAVDKASKRFGKLADDIKKKMTKAFKVVGVAAAGAAVAVVKTTADFDAAMTQSLAIMGDVSEAMRKDMSDAAREVAKVTTFSASQAAKAYFYLASAGLDAKASLEALPIVARFAQAGMFDLATATDLLTDAQSALGLTIRDDAVANMKNMIALSDILVKANTLSNATVEQFSRSLTNKAAAAMRDLNMETEEGVAILAAFADQGIKGEQAGEKLFILLRDLQSSQLRNRKEWEKFNITAYDSEGAMRSVADIMRDLTGLLSGMSDEQKRATLIALGFQDRSVAVISTLLGMSDAIRMYETNIRQAAGTTEDIATKQLNTFNAQLKLLWHAIQDVAIEVGTELLPKLKAFVEDVAKPWVATDLPKHVRALRDAFVQIVPTLQDAALALAEIAKGTKDFGDWIIRNQTRLVLAIAAIGAALVWATPVGGVIYGLGLIAIGIAALRIPVEDLHGPLLELKRLILEVEHGFLEMVFNINTLGLTKIPGLEGPMRELSSKINIFSAMSIDRLKEVEAELDKIDQRKIDLDVQDALNSLSRLRDDASYTGMSIAKVQRAIAEGYLAEMRMAAGEVARYAVGPAPGDILEIQNALALLTVTASKVPPIPPLPEFDDEEAAATIDELTEAFLRLAAAAGVSQQTMADWPMVFDLALRAARRLGWGGEELEKVFTASGKAFGDFARRLAAAEALNVLRVQVERAVGALDELRSAFTGLFMKPTIEEARIQEQLAKLRLRRARAVMAGATAEELAAIDREIQQIENIVAVRQAENDLMEARLDIADKTLLSDADRLVAARDLIIEMRNLSAVAVPLIQLYRDQAEAMHGWMTSLAAWVETLTAAPLPTEVRGYQQGGVVPGPYGQPQLAVVHGGETVLPAGRGGWTVNVPLNLTLQGFDRARLRQILSRELDAALLQAEGKSYRAGHPLSSAIE